jgi:hypothetical protein
MPVPRRRQQAKGFSLLKNMRTFIFKIVDIDFLFQNTRIALLYGFAPTVIAIGMFTEPSPASWFDIINILE